MTYANWLYDVAVDAGLRVIAHDGWEHRGGATFTPKGIVWHHTVSAKPIDRMLIEGRPDLAGPLCNWSTHPDGTVAIIAAGTANHAGRDHAGNPLRQFGANHNSEVYGDELVHPGTIDVPWPAEQLAAARQMSAALCKFHLDWSGDRCASHRSWAGPRKIDPVGLETSWIQAAVTETIGQQKEPGMLETYIAAAYVKFRGYDPRQNGLDIGGLMFWLETAALEHPDRAGWSWTDCQASPTLRTMLVLFADE